MQLNNLIELPLWVKFSLPITLGIIQSISETLVFHREGTHKSLILNVYVKSFFQIFLAFLTGVPEKVWVTLHASHHKDPDGKNDITSPHNPQYVRILGKKRKLSGPLLSFVLYFFLYKKSNFFKIVKNKDNTSAYVPENITTAVKKENWFFQIFLHKYVKVGPILFFILCIVFFGWYGVVLFITQFLWLPFFAGYVVNGLGHNKKERNTKNPNDFSTNVSFFKNKILKKISQIVLSILTAGESGHYDHHAYQASARIGSLDFGWFIITILKKLQLVSYLRYYYEDDQKMIIWKK